MIPEWQKRRSRFNHDWLKNQFLPAVACWLNILDDQLEDPDFEKSFRQSCLALWGTHRDEVIELVGDFELQMSPRVLLDKEPLSGLEDAERNQLKNLVHNLWLARYAVPKLVAEALSSVEAVDEAYQQLQRRIQLDSEAWSVAGERRFRSEWGEFRDLCQRLGKAIEAFPGEVKVI